MIEDIYGEEEYFATLEEEEGYQGPENNVDYWYDMMRDDMTFFSIPELLSSYSEDLVRKYRLYDLLEYRAVEKMKKEKIEEAKEIYNKYKDKTSLENVANLMLHETPVSLLTQYPNHVSYENAFINP